MNNAFAPTNVRGLAKIIAQADSRLCQRGANYAPGKRAFFSSHLSAIR